MCDCSIITRRGLVKSGAAALGAGVACISVPALASPAPDLDAALVHLIARHATALTDLAALDDVADPFRSRFEEMAPERPAALLWQGDDVMHGIGPTSGKVPNGRGRYRGLFNHNDVERLRTAPPLTKWGPSADGEEPYRVPDPAGETRRWEIVEAHDAWMSEKKALADRIGLTEANAACDRLSDIVCDIEMAIMDRAPVTLDGFRAKARWIAASKQPEGWAEALLRDLCGGMAS